MSELFQEAVIISILAGSFRVMTPILFAAIGELVTQRAGIWNMGVEGTMIMGAFTSYMVATTTGSLYLAVLGGVFSGMIMGLITYIIGMITFNLSFKKKSDDDKPKGLNMVFFSTGFLLHIIIELVGVSKNVC